MLLWFAGLSVVLVWAVFRDPAIDYRLVVAGALLPDAVDGVLGGVGPAHAVLASAGLLAGVMLVTRGRRAARRRLLALPIGSFAHLLLDGAWAEGEAFWWPLLDTALAEEPLPSQERPVVLLVAMEAAGAAALVWAWFRFQLADTGRRRALITTGRLPRQAAP